MAIERERKFLPGGEPMDLTGWDYEMIEQGYLVLDPKNGKQCRVRKSGWYRPDGRVFPNYTLTYKQSIEEGIRTEIESTVNASFGQELLDACEWKLTKERWTKDFHNGVESYPSDESHSVCVDKYPDGTTVIEVEYPNDDMSWIHNICGKEVTGVKKYSNIEIAKNNKRDDNK